MTPERATDILKGDVPCTATERLEARLAIAVEMVENYQIDIRQRGLDAEGFCQGRAYQRWSELLGLGWEPAAAPPPKEGL